MTFRKLVFWMHLVAGCVAGTVIFIMSITGAAIAYQRQIISWLDRDFRVAPAPARLPIEAMMARIVTENHAAPSSITLHSDPSAPAEAGFGRNRILLIDPYTGHVLGESAPRVRAWFRTAEDWHRWLGADGQRRATARAITGACNLAFFFLVVSGPFLWIPRRWSARNVRAIAFFRAAVSGRARDFNWHNVIGIWCAAPLAVIVFSGAVMSYPWANDLIFRLTGNDPPTASQRGPERREDATPTLAGIDLLWSAAEKQVPDWRSITLRLPSGRGPVTFSIDTGDGGRPDQRAQLTLNRRTGEIVRWEPFSSYNSGRRLRSWLRFAHTGEAGGIVGQTIAGIASTGAAILAITGLSLAIRRLSRKFRRGNAVGAAGGESAAIARD